LEKKANQQLAQTKPNNTLAALSHRKIGEEKYMQTLPPEIVDIVLAFVGPLPHARVVCQQWRVLIDHRQGRWRPPSADNYMGLLARHNARAVIQWARADGCPWDANACAEAAKGGHLDLLQWLRRNGCPWNTLAYGWAMVKSHAHIVEWFDDNERLVKIDDLWEPAIRQGHIEIVDWLLEHGHPWPRGSCCFAAQSGRLDLLQRARPEGVSQHQPWGCCSRAAAKGGHIHVLEWLHAHHLAVLGEAMSAAAWAGRLDVIQWTTDHGQAPRLQTLMYAAGGGHRHVIEWLRDRGQPWHGGITGYAAAHGHFGLLRWLYEQGCDLSTSTFVMASGKAPIPILEWLRDQRCPLKVKDCLRDACTDEARALIASCAHLDYDRTGRASRTIHGDDYSDDDGDDDT
jgi:hypothetical protein